MGWKREEMCVRVSWLKFLLGSLTGDRNMLQQQAAHAGPANSLETRHPDCLLVQTPDTQTVCQFRHPDS